MTKNRRGFKLKRKKSTSNHTIFLFEINGSKYLVSVHFYFLRIFWKKKNYEFKTEEDASRFYEKINLRFG